MSSIEKLKRKIRNLTAGSDDEEQSPKEPPKKSRTEATSGQRSIPIEASYSSSSTSATQHQPSRPQRPAPTLGQKYDPRKDAAPVQNKPFPAPPKKPTFGTHVVSTGSSQSTSIDVPSNREDFKEQYSKLYLKTRVISSALMHERMAGKTIVQLNSVGLHANSTSGNQPKNDWVTFAVVVEKGDIRETSKNEKFIQMKLMRLDSPTETGVNLLLFGDAYLKFWKLSLGSVIGLLNPTVLPPSDNKNSQYALKLSHPLSLMYMGTSYDFGYCKSTRKDGTPCTMPVNKHVCEFCRFHITNIKKKLNNNRPNLTSSMKAEPKAKAVNGVYFVNGSLISTAGGGVKRPSLSSSNATDNAMLKAFMQTGSTGAKYIQHLKNAPPGSEVMRSGDSKTNSPGQNIGKPITDLRSLFQPTSNSVASAAKRGLVELEEDDLDVAASRAKAREHVLRNNIKYAKHDPNKPWRSALPVTNEDLERRKQAAKENKVLAQQSLERKTTFEDLEDEEKQRVERSRKRANAFGVDLSSADAKRRLTGSQVGLTADDLAEFQRQCARHEKLEMVDKVLSERHSMTVDGWFCYECGKARTILPEKCKANNHRTERRKITKYFWKCAGCQSRSETLQSARPPPHDCKRCNRNDWEPASMNRSRTTVQAVPKVEARGPEQLKFLGTDR